MPLGVVTICFITATVPILYISFLVGLSTFTSCCAQRKTYPSPSRAFIMLFIVISLPTSKCTVIPGNTTRSLVGIIGITFPDSFISILSFLSFIKPPAAVKTQETASFICKITHLLYASKAEPPYGPPLVTQLYHNLRSIASADNAVTQTSQYFFQKITKRGTLKGYL